MKSLNRIKLKYVADYIQRGDAPTYVDSNGVSVMGACGETNLHIPPILPAHLEQRIRDLPQ